MQMQTLRLTGILELLGLLAAPFAAHAANVNNLGDLATFFLGILNSLIPILIGIALVFFLYGLLRYVLMGANEDVRGEAVWYMVLGIVGLTIMVGIWGIVNILLSSFGIIDVVPRS